MDCNMEGKVALISGGGTGIGEACARLLATNGCSVAVVGRRYEPISQVAEDVGGLAVQGDASNHNDCRSVVEKITSRFGRLDILISSAGIMREGSITTMSPEDWQQSMDANLNSIMELSRASLPTMIEGGGGTIVNVASLGGLVAPGNMAAYITSKTAVIGLTRSLAVDYGPKGVRVNTLCPGWVLTPMSESEMAHYAKESNITTAEAIEHATRYLPLKRMAKPEEIARCVRFLASDESSFITGTTLVADGGSSAVDVGYISL
jgi:meso-butanediol dehydrogenase/(S,S)-butanediol dehydrogenase/diacetyl reductase